MTEKLANLQILRFLAATAVVVFHANGLCLKYCQETAGPSALVSWLRALGVDVFFVLSGVVIGLVARGGAGNFLLRRAIRIVPLYWLLTVCFFIAVMALPQHTLHSSDVGKLFQSLAFVAFLDLGSGAQWPVLYLGWTLEYEAIFYLLVALMLATKQSVVRGVSVVLLVVFVAANLAISADLPFFGISQQLSQSLILNFALGLVLCNCLLGGRGVIEIIAIVGAAAAVVLLVGHEARLFTTGFPAVAIVAAAMFLEQRGLRASGAFVRLGDASYAIYLVQVFTLSLAGKIYQTFFPSFPAMALFVVATVLTIAAGTSLHSLVEAPLIERLKNTVRAASGGSEASSQRGRGRFVRQHGG